MECARKHLGKGLENASEGGRSTGERDGFPLGIRIGGRVRHSELVGAMSRDSCKYIAQLPRGLAKGMGAGPAPHGRSFPGGELRGEPPKTPSQEIGKLQSHTKQPDP